MAEQSRISWTDATFNPWIGCTKVSPACAHCYAERDFDRRKHIAKWGDQGTRVMTSPENWKKPRKWNELAGLGVCLACHPTIKLDGTRRPCSVCNSTGKLDRRPRIFCASLADVFEERPLVEWKEISEGYRVSIYGEVQSRWRPGGHLADEWRTMGLRKDKGGYLTLDVDGKTRKVHLLVMEAFVGPRPEGMQTRHLDGNTTNNVLWNLSYGTSKENHADRRIHGTGPVGKSNGRAKLTETDVKDIKQSLASGVTQESLAKKYGVVQATISKIALGKNWVVREATAPSTANRNCVPGQMIDSQGRPLFHSESGYSHEPDTILVRDWKPVAMDDVRRDLFELIDATPNLNWLILTKRPENIARMWCSHVNTDGKPPSMLRRENVWLGCSVENQEYADKRIPELLKCSALAPVLFLSCEPLLGPVELPLCFHSSSDPNQFDHSECAPIPNWVIAGGESGPNARPSHPEWFRSLRDQCEAAGVPFHFKQWGEWSPFYDRDKDDPGWDAIPNEDGPKVTRLNLAGGRGFHGDRLVYFNRVGVKQAGRLLDGVLHDAFPITVEAPQ